MKLLKVLCPVLCMFAGSACADQKVITAELGHTVTLPCRAANNNNKPIVVVEWSRADLGPAYVFLYRDEQPLPDNQHPSFKNRVDLLDRQMKDGDVSLILKDATINDTGTYECRIVQGRTNRRKRAHLKTVPISTINLRVVPPGPAGPPGRQRGLAIGLSLSALVAAVVGFVIYKKCKQSEDSYQPSAEEQQL